MSIEKLIYDQPYQSFPFLFVFLFPNLVLTQYLYFHSICQPESQREEGWERYHILRPYLYVN